jgi:hypothetical protein
LEVVFPIVATDGDDAWTPLGTGFFIGKWGLFATAKHVLVEDDKLQPGLAGLQILPAQRAIIIRRLENISPHPLADVAIGCLAQETSHAASIWNHFLTLSCRIAAAGDPVCTYAYPRSKCIGQTEAGSFELGFPCEEFPGEVLEYLPAGTGTRMHRGPCYRTTCNPLGGASGGPLASMGGTVLGIYNTGFTGVDEGFFSATAAILELKVRGVVLPGEHAARDVSLVDLAALGVVAFEQRGD